MTGERALRKALAEPCRWAGAQGIDRAFEAMEVATQMVEDARPLLNRAIELVDEVRTVVPKP